MAALVRLGFQIVVLSCSIHAAFAVAANMITISPSCPAECNGNSVSIPYPFGIGAGCFLSKWFEIVCNESDSINGKQELPVLRQFNLEVLEILLHKNRVRVNYPVFMSCADNVSKTPKKELEGSPFVFSSSENSFIAMGCNNSATIWTIDNEKVSIGAVCRTPCDHSNISKSSTNDQKIRCEDTDCCQTSIPSIPLDIHSLLTEIQPRDPSDKLLDGECRYAFLAEHGWFEDNFTMPKPDISFPVLLDWGIDSPSITLLPIKPSVDVKNKNKTINDSFWCRCGYPSLNQGCTYTCRCGSGFNGNPYLLQGCRDVNEINTGTPPPPTSAKLPPRKSSKRTRAIIIGLSTSLGLMGIMNGGWLSYKAARKIKNIKHMGKIFKRNGGLSLEQQLSSNEANVQTTDPFIVNRMLGKGEQETSDFMDSDHTSPSTSVPSSSTPVTRARVQPQHATTVTYRQAGFVTPVTSAAIGIVTSCASTSSKFLLPDQIDEETIIGNSDFSTDVEEGEQKEEEHLDQMLGDDSLAPESRPGTRARVQPRRATTVTSRQKGSATTVTTAAIGTATSCVSTSSKFLLLDQIDEEAVLGISNFLTDIEEEENLDQMLGDDPSAPEPRPVTRARVQPRRATTVTPRQTSSATLVTPAAIGTATSCASTGSKFLLPYQIDEEAVLGISDFATNVEEEEHLDKILGDDPPAPEPRPATRARVQPRRATTVTPRQTDSTTPVTPVAIGTATSCASTISKFLLPYQIDEEAVLGISDFSTNVKEEENLYQMLEDDTLALEPRLVTRARVQPRRVTTIMPRQTGFATPVTHAAIETATSCVSTSSKFPLPDQIDEEAVLGISKFLTDVEEKEQEEEDHLNQMLGDDPLALEPRPATRARVQPRHATTVMPRQTGSATLVTPAAIGTATSCVSTGSKFLLPYQIDEEAVLGISNFSTNVEEEEHLDKMLGDDPHALEPRPTTCARVQPRRATTITPRQTGFTTPITPVAIGTATSCASTTSKFLLPYQIDEEAVLGISDFLTDVKEEEHLDQMLRDDSLALEPQPMTHARVQPRRATIVMPRQTGFVTPITPAAIGTVTSCVSTSSKLLLNQIEEEAVIGISDFPIDVQEEEYLDQMLGDDSPSPKPRPPLPRSIKKRLWIWEHFTKVFGDAENPQARCHYCGVLCDCQSNKQGTSLLISHLTSCQRYKIHKEEATKIGSQQTKLSYEMTVGPDGTQSKNLTMPVYDEKYLRQCVTEWIIKDEQPFIAVEGKGFRKMCNALESRFTPPSRYTVMRDCMKLHSKEHLRIKEMFSMTGQRVSLTTNIWTSVQNITYICITTHWIDSDWTLQKRVIKFKHIEDHKGSSIGAELDDAMKEWGIRKILCVTVDNASANDTVIDWLRQNTTVIEDPIRGNEFMHVSCAAHILNLIVQDGLKEIDESILKVRDIVRYVRASSQRLVKFKVIAEQLQILSSSMLSLDVPTRWNSTYMMLEVATKYQKVFEQMEAQDEALRYALYETGGRRAGLGPPDSYDWTRVRFFIDFLKIFYDTTLRISDTQNCTASMYFEEVASLSMHLQSILDDNSDATGLLHDMALMMQAIYNKYWGDVEKINRLLVIAAMLDPQYKLNIIEFWAKSLLGDEPAAQFVSLLKLEMEHLYNHYNNGEGSRLTTDATSLEPSGSSSISTRCVNFLMRTFHESRAYGNILLYKSEIERYFTEDVEAPSETYDILTWWKVNSTKYPVLSRVARDVLAIPITMVTSESAFSTSSRVLDAYQSSLSPKTVEALICTQNWLRKDDVGLALVPVDDVESYKLEFDVEADPNLLLKD